MNAVDVCSSTNMMELSFLGKAFTGTDAGEAATVLELHGLGCIVDRDTKHGQIFAIAQPFGLLMLVTELLLKMLMALISGVSMDSVYWDDPHGNTQVIRYNKWAQTGA